jgi:hypothetical protein
LESNEKRKDEVKDEDVRAEVEKVKRRAEILQRELMERLEEHGSNRKW